MIFEVKIEISVKSCTVSIVRTGTAQFCAIYFNKELEGQECVQRRPKLKGEEGKTM